MPSLHTLTLQAATHEFLRTKRYIEQSLSQLRDEDLFARLNPQQCSIGAYLRHLAGNMRSRWTDFLTTDGEKPDRNRESEFAETPASRAELLATLDQSWQTLFTTLANLQEGDLERTITIRTEPLTVIDAILRQQAHYAWHAGQIALLAKHLKHTRQEPWSYLTIPPGGSAAFNKSKGM